MYTPTGLDILTKSSHRASDFQIEQLYRTVGLEFTFFKFLDFLVNVAELSYEDKENLILVDKVCFLLERMELSKGYQ